MNTASYPNVRIATQVENGTRKNIHGKASVYYDGYWIRYYAPPANTLAAKKDLIDSLTRRLFHHTEPGINTPGKRLEEARQAYERETDPAKKRINGAMLAGALFHRAGDIFTTVVELAEKRMEVSPNDELMSQCGEYFQEALELGKSVKHRSGCEGIDELWGEPLKAFTMPIEAFYESRYIKIAQTMRDIDAITKKLISLLGGNGAAHGIAAGIKEFSEAAKLVSETIKSDPVIFDVWPRFVAAGEKLVNCGTVLDPAGELHDSEELVVLIREGKDLISYLAGARVPMPKSTREFVSKCEDYSRRLMETDRNSSRRAS